MIKYRYFRSELKVQIFTINFLQKVEQWARVVALLLLLPEPLRQGRGLDQTQYALDPALKGQELEPVQGAVLTTPALSAIPGQEDLALDPPDQDLPAQGPGHSQGQQRLVETGKIHSQPTALEYLG